MDMTRRGAGAMIASLAAAPFFGVTKAAGAAPVIRFSYQRSSALLTLLKANGSLEQKLAAKGFGISWNLFDDIIQPMNAGAVDFHSDVADAVPVFTQSAGAPIALYAKEEGSTSAEAIIVRAEAPIHSIADLKGKTVAVHRGSGSHFVLAAALKRAGLSFRDITPAYLSPSDAAVAFGRGSVDAWSIWDPFLAITEAKLPTRTLCDATGLSSYHRYYAVNNSFADAHSDLIVLVIDALTETGLWVKKNPEEAAKRLAPLWGGIAVDVVATVNRRRTYQVKPVTKDGLGDQQIIADTFFEAGLIPKRIDATAVRLWHDPDRRT